MLPDQKQSSNIIAIKKDNKTECIMFTISVFPMQYTQYLLNQTIFTLLILKADRHILSSFIVSSDLGAWE